MKRRERRSLQTGSTSFGVSLSQTNGLRLFDAVFHRNLLYIIPRALDDIGPCLPGVALMSLIAPPVRLLTTGSRYRDKTSGTGFFPLSVVPRDTLPFSLARSPALFLDRRAFLLKLSGLTTRWKRRRSVFRKSHRVFIARPGTLTCLGSAQ